MHILECIILKPGNMITCVCSKDGELPGFNRIPVEGVGFWHHA
jgi:hypothetical protein